MAFFIKTRMPTLSHPPPPYGSHKNNLSKPRPGNARRTIKRQDKRHTHSPTHPLTASWPHCALFGHCTEGEGQHYHRHSVAPLPPVGTASDHPSMRHATEHRQAGRDRSTVAENTTRNTWPLCCECCIGRFHLLNGLHLLHFETPPPPIFFFCDLTTPVWCTSMSLPYLVVGHNISSLSQTP